MDARERALRVLYDIEYNGAYSNLALKTALGECDARDRALVTALVYGVTDKRLTLDYIITRHSKLKLKKISKYIRVILRMGIYQLKFADKIPASAAVNESVKLAKRYGHASSAGFVNGVLRSVERSKIEYPTDKTEYLAVKYSFPTELCAEWTERFGYEFTEKLMTACGEAAPLTLRPNRLKTTPEKLTARLKENGVKAEITDGYIRAAGFDIAHDDLYKNGFYTVQDAAAMKASEILAPKSGETVIDMCAAPGGKTTHMAEIMEDKGKIFAFDIYEHKLDLIRKNAERLGITIIETALRDGREFDARYAESADKILCDAPCSGLGIIRRKPEIKYGYDADNDLPETQRAILDNAARYLKAGGEIVYSTCTIEKRENEDVTGGFLRDNTGFEKLYEKTFYPHIDGTDGFYICKMRKNV